MSSFVPSILFALLEVLVACTASGSTVNTTGDGGDNTTHVSKLLFLDDQVLSPPGLHGGAELELQIPEKLGRVITPEYEWEMWELGGYDAWLQLPNVRQQSIVHILRVPKLTIYGDIMQW